MTRLMAIETSSEACSVALLSGDDCLLRFEHAPRGHAERLLPWVQELLAEAGTTLTNLDALAFSRGPGSFTSLRIGVSVTQGLAFGADLPVVPVSSLQAVAQQAAAQGVERALVAMDARMNEVFSAAYVLQEGIMQLEGEERVGPASETASRATTQWTGVGNGFIRFEELANSRQHLANILPDLWPRASETAQLAKAWLTHHTPLPPEAAQPVYIRDKVAETIAERTST